MNIESYCNYCRSFKGVTEEFPFDKNALVHKVMGKMFVLTDLDQFTSVNPKIVIRKDSFARGVTNPDGTARNVRINPDIENERKTYSHRMIQTFHFQSSAQSAKKS